MTRIRRRFLALLLPLLVAVSAPATADTGSDSKTVGNVKIYMGLLPADMIRGHPAGHPEASMHGGAREGGDEYHVIIALFDAKTGSRIESADISARVSEVGLAGAEKKLEPMQIAGTVTYGNFFRMAGNGPFEIAVTIRLPGQAQAITTSFEHRHQ